MYLLQWCWKAECPQASGKCPNSCFVLRCHSGFSQYHASVDHLNVHYQKIVMFFPSVTWKRWNLEQLCHILWSGCHTYSSRKCRIMFVLHHNCQHHINNRATEDIIWWTVSHLLKFIGGHLSKVWEELSAYLKVWFLFVLSLTAISLVATFYEFHTIKCWYDKLLGFTYIHFSYIFV